MPLPRLVLTATVAIALVAAAPLVACAQPAAKVYRIGVLGNENAPPWEGLRQGLRDLGYVDGRNITMEWRWSEGRTDRLPALAIELAGRSGDPMTRRQSSIERTLHG